MATQVTLNSGSVDSAGSLALKTNGTTTAVTIDTAQNVGVGATPSAWGSTAKTVQLPNGCAIANLGAGDVVVTQNAYFDNPNFKYASTTGVGSSVYRQIDGTHRWSYSASGTAGNNITFTEAMRIDSSGNVGIGTSSPTVKLDVVTASGASYVRTYNGTIDLYSGVQPTTGGALIGTVSNHPLVFFANNADRGRFDTSGNLLVGKTVTSVGTAGTWIEGTGSLVSSLAASTAASSTLHAYSTTASAYRFYVGMDGRVNATLTTISAISDERLKENIKDLDFGLSEVLSLKPRRFDWKEGKGADTKDAVGFIAQEFETVFPNSVGTAKAGEDGIEYKNICHDELIPTLVKAIQEQQALITTLTDRITALEAK